MIRVIAGDDPLYWDNQWSATDTISQRDRALRNPTYLESLIAHGVETGPVLEAGCGSGWVVSWLESLGYETVGLDFAQESLRRAHASLSPRALVSGNLESLPFDSESFNAVVSLGAVEHIESGPLRALHEHRRVLRRGGQLLLTVPRLNIVKWLNDLVGCRLAHREYYRSPRGRWVSRRTTLEQESSAGYRFLQYELWVTHWKQLLQQANFTVLDYQPVLIDAGLGELGLLNRIRATAPCTSAGHTSDRGSPSVGTSSSRRLWTAAVSQESVTQLERLVSDLLGRSVAHMAFFLAVAG